MFSRLLIQLGVIKNAATAGNLRQLMKEVEIRNLHRHAWTYCYNPPSTAHIELTNLCNLRCKWCYRNDESLHKLGFGSMDIIQFKEIVRQLKGIKVLFLQGNGEPLLHKDLIEAINYSAKFIPKVNIGTNATLLNEDMARRLAESKLSTLCVSIDAADKQTFEYIRGCDLERVCYNVKYFRSISDIPIVIWSTVSRQNMESLIDIPRLAKGLGANWISVQHLRQNDGSRKHNLSRIILKEELDDFVNRISENGKRASVSIHVALMGEPFTTDHICCLPFNDPMLYVA